MSLIGSSFRKAGSYLNNHRMIAGLAAAGGVLGAAGVLRKLNQDEQELVLDAAVEAESQGGGLVLGMGSGTLITAAAVLAITENEEDEDRTTTSDANAVDDMASDVRVRDIANKQTKPASRRR